MKLKRVVVVIVTVVDQSTRDLIRVVVVTVTVVDQSTRDLIRVVVVTVTVVDQSTVLRIYCGQTQYYDYNYFLIIHAY